ncbi:FMN-linked oxidoreductase [Rhizopogon salebrosus TDB-379]|nr:FMN-linked oxidoreductase [Rhizopogon salebrosus TDB-379]
MSRRPISTSPAPPDDSQRATKRQRLDHLTPESFRNGVFLAPMVRSGALPTRLMALKHGATLVWGPEIVDKAILHAEREVHPVTGVVSYNGKSRAMFTTHPLEKPYLIYQIGSADPELAVQAAKTVMQDVSGVDLNCGCPKPFSTHSGMGAALLSNPDLLCGILEALRRELPREISVSAKIRLLPTQDETKKLVERIARTGVNAITIHCRTRNMRPRERALVERLREIVEFVHELGLDVAIVENGDCTGREGARRVRELTGADSVMIATAAESNPSCFSSTPLQDVESTLVPSYLRLCKYLDNHWSSTKFCVTQFKGTRSELSKTDIQGLKLRIAKAKMYEDVEDIVGSWMGEEEFQQITRAVEARPPRIPTVAEQAEAAEEDIPAPCATPPDRANPEPPSSGAPKMGLRMPLPAIITGSDMISPTPTPGGTR